MDKVFTFTYEGQLYITIKPISALKSKHSYTNAIPVANVDWNVQLEYITCGKSVIPCKNIEDIPVLEDATVTRDGDNFIVSGLIHGDNVVYNVTMDANDMTISESIPESTTMEIKPPEPVTEDTVPNTAPVVTEVASSLGAKVHFGIATHAPRMTFKQPSHTVHRVDVPTETVKTPAPIQVKQEPITVESIKHTSFTRDEIFILAGHFATLVRLYQPAVVETVQVRETPVEVPVSQATPGLSFRQTELPHLSASSPGVIPLTPIATKEVPVAKEVATTELSSYSDVLATIPLPLLTNCSAYTAAKVDKDEVLAGGAVYCMSSGWSHDGDWYAIDEVATVTRHFLDVSTEKYYAIPVADIKAWINVNC